MYISGVNNNFLVRLNQLPTSGQDIQKFELEGYSYTGNWNQNKVKYQNQRLLVKKAASIVKTGYAIESMFTGIRYF